LTSTHNLTGPERSLTCSRHRIENALPGRESFDIEIYGMEGIPAPDLAEWKKRKAAQSGINLDAGKSKRPKLDLSVISTDQLRILVQTHKTVMGGQSNTAYPAPGAQNYGVVPPLPGFTLPPPISGAPALPLPPPGFPLPFPPPPGFPFPPGSLPPPSLIPGMPPRPSVPLGAPNLPTMTTIEPTEGKKDDVEMRDIQKTDSVPVESSRKTLKPGLVLVYGDDEISAVSSSFSSTLLSCAGIEVIYRKKNGRLNLVTRIRKSLQWVKPRRELQLQISFKVARVNKMHEFVLVTRSGLWSYQKLLKPSYLYSEFSA
jgi:hypothetical protein